MNPLPQKVAAVLFDMDNTLVETEQAWFDATEQLWREAGGDPTGKGMLGGALVDLIEEFCQAYPGTDPLELELRFRGMLQGYLQGTVKPMPGAPELVERLQQVVPVTIASNSPSDIVQQVVAEVGWQQWFTAALGTEDVETPKPAPDLYLAAAKACGARAQDCVVFEDSPTGAAAAKAAGAFLVTIGPAAVGLGDLAVDSLQDPIITNWFPEAIS